MNFIIFGFFTLIYLFIFCKCNNPLKIPIQEFKKINFYENNIYISINIGTPSQKIPLKISISSNPTFITKSCLLSSTIFKSLT